MRLVLASINEGELRAVQGLARFEANLLMPLAGWEAVGTILRAVAERQFDTEGGYASGGWQPLADSTVAEKERLGLDPRILRATGALMESLTRKFDPMHIEVPSRDSLVFGSRVGYGIYHASLEPRTKIPYRPPLQLTVADRVAMRVAMQKALLGFKPTGLDGQAASPVPDISGVYGDIQSMFAPTEAPPPSAPIDRLGFGGSA